jgi:hypothetical protein
MENEKVAPGPSPKAEVHVLDAGHFAWTQPRMKSPR